MCYQEQVIEAYEQSGTSPPGAATYLAADASTRVTTPPNRLRLLTTEEVLKGPDQEWLVQGLIPVGGLTVLYGPSGHGKSFIALAMALSVATGLDWWNVKVQQGAVVYVAAEGGRGLKKRIKAWLREFGDHPPQEAFFVLEPVQVRDKNDLNLVLQQLKSKYIRPKLIVIDTMARCFVGGQENDAKDVGELVYAIWTLQCQTGAAVLVVHHTGKNKQQIERGSSALRGAADSMMLAKIDNKKVVTITSDKMKDDEVPGPIRLKLKQVLVDVTDTGERITSCVLVHPDADGEEPELGDNHRRALKALADLSAGEPVKSGDWRLKTGLADRTFYRIKNELTNWHYVRPLCGKGHPYVLSEVGAAIAKGLPSMCQGSCPASTAATPTPLAGVAVAGGVADTCTTDRNSVDWKEGAHEDND